MIQSYIFIDEKAIYTAKQDASTYILASIDGKSIGIAEVRKAITWSNQTSFEGGIKQLIIIQAQYLTQESQQALLKTLEEPTETTRIILTVNRPTSLLPTILSRCAQQDINQLNQEDLRTYNLIKQEKPEQRVYISLQDLLKQSELQRWLTVEQLFQDKTDIRDALNQWMQEARRDIQAHPQQATELLKVAGHIDRAQQDIKANVQPRLAIDQLLLNFTA